MYCSSCGVAVAQGLSYCNYCGAKLSGEKADSVSKSSEANPQFLLSSMIALFILGLAVITILMGVMKVVLGLPVERVLAFALMPFLVMLLLEGLCLRLLLRCNRGAKRTSDNVLLQERTTKELDAARDRLLQEPVSSVTDQTTRTLEPLYNERKSK
jgi:hypothetical protein